MNAWIRNSIIRLLYRTKLVLIITSRNPVSPFTIMAVDFDYSTRDSLISSLPRTPVLGSHPIASRMTIVPGFVTAFQRSANRLRKLEKETIQGHR